MSRGVNKVILVGRLGDDPDVRHTPSGSAVTNISIATSESWKDKKTDEKQERTTWHRITFFGRLAEIAGEYCKKGSQVYVEGSLRTDKYQDKKTGEDRYSTSIIANNLQLLGGKQNGQSNSRDETGGAKTHRAPAGEDFDDEIPFAPYLREWLC